MRTLVRLAALVVIGAVAFVVASRWAPSGSWFAQAGDAFLRALQFQWNPTITP